MRRELFAESIMPNSHRIGSGVLQACFKDVANSGLVNGFPEPNPTVCSYRGWASGLEPDDDIASVQPAVPVHKTESVRNYFSRFERSFMFPVLELNAVIPATFSVL